MTDFRVEGTRGGLVESVHRVSVAVVDAQGTLLAAAGDPGLVTYWRSAAKPFQALPVLQDGAADAAGFTGEHVALACASHSSEPRHRALALEMLRLAGATEADLACGPHVPLSPEVAAEVARAPERFTPAWSNCSGKHAAMLALVRHAGWPVAGYERAGHPLQRRILAEVSRWTGVAPDDIALGTDGCTAACFGLPLRAMALAYARLAASDEPAAGRVRTAMVAHPWLVAGTGRACTDVMTAGAGDLLVKLGADGIYSGAVRSAGLGFTLKVEDGDLRSAAPALVGVLRALGESLAPALAPVAAAPAVARHDALPIRSTRGEQVGELRAAGALRVFAPDRAATMSAAHAE